MLRASSTASLYIEIRSLIVKENLSVKHFSVKKGTFNILVDTQFRTRNETERRTEKTNSKDTWEYKYKLWLVSFWCWNCSQFHGRSLAFVRSWSLNSVQIKSTFTVSSTWSCAPLPQHSLSLSSTRSKFVYDCRIVCRLHLTLPHSRAYCCVT